MGYHPGNPSAHAPKQGETRDLTERRGASSGMSRGAPWGSPRPHATAKRRTACHLHLLDSTDRQPTACLDGLVRLRPARGSAAPSTWPPSLESQRENRVHGAAWGRTEPHGARGLACGMRRRSGERRAIYLTALALTGSRRRASTASSDCARRAAQRRPAPAPPPCSLESQRETRVHGGAAWGRTEPHGAWHVACDGEVANGVPFT
jgi:hypothetical protein